MGGAPRLFSPWALARRSICSKRAAPRARPSGLISEPRALFYPQSRVLSARIALMSFRACEAFLFCNCPEKQRTVRTADAVEISNCNAACFATFQ